MSYVRFMNGDMPNIWSFIAEMGGPGLQPDDRGRNGPPGWGWSPFDEAQHDLPFRGRRHGPPGAPHGPHHGRRGPHYHHHSPPPPPGDEVPAQSGAEQTRDNGHAPPAFDDPAAVPDPDIVTPGDEMSDNEHRGWRHGHRGGRCGPGRRGGFGPHGMRGWHPWGPWAVPQHYGRHGGWGRHGGRRGGPVPPFMAGGAAAAGNPFAQIGSMFGLDPAAFDTEHVREALADAFTTAATVVHPNNNDNNNTTTGNPDHRGARDGSGVAATAESETEVGDNTETENKKSSNKDREIDFRPAADIYDTESAYVVHFALPGAKKEDISLNWDAERSELQVVGVIAREGDEDMIKALALDERDVGVFERRVKLGREGVDADGISARMENGLLVVKVPKRVDEDWTEVKRVDIE